MDYSYAIERHDVMRISKLNELGNPKTFWDDVRKLTSRVTSDHAIGRWKALADVRYKEIQHRMY